MDPLHVGATWLHAAAMVLVLGYYAVLGWVILPVLARIGGSGVGPDTGAVGATVAAVERRALPLLVGSILVFTGTGIYLMLGDGRYDGFGNVTASDWTMLMLAKHAVIAVMVGLGVTLHLLATRGRGDGATDTDVRRVRTLRWLADLIAILGVVVLLLTAMAQSSA